MTVAGQFPTAAQFRAARAMLAWTQAQLAVASGVGLSTLKAVEAGTGKPTKPNLLALKLALETAGIAFTPCGVELHPLAAPGDVDPGGRSRHRPGPDAEDHAAGEEDHRTGGAGSHRQGGGRAVPRPGPADG